MGIELEWHGKNEHEIGMDKSTRKVLVEIDPGYFRPNKVDISIDNQEKARKQLGWQPKTKRFNNHRASAGGNLSYKEAHELSNYETRINVFRNIM